MILGDGFVLIPPEQPDGNGYLPKGRNPTHPNPVLVSSGVRFVAHLVRKSRASGEPFKLRLDEVINEWNALNLLVDLDPGFPEICMACDVVLEQTLPYSVQLPSPMVEDSVHGGVWSEMRPFSGTLRFSDSNSAVYATLLHAQS